MTYENGKKSILISFIGLLALEFLSFINNACYCLFDRAFLPSIPYVSYLFILLAAFGFFVLWQSRKNTLDIAIAGALILTLIINFFWGRILSRLLSSADNLKTYIIVSFLFTLIACAYLAIWALKMFKNGNVIAAGLLGAAFLYRCFSSVFYAVVVDLSGFGLIIYYFGFLVAAAIPAFVAFTDKE